MNVPFPSPVVQALLAALCLFCLPAGFAPEARAERLEIPGTGESQQLLQALGQAFANTAGGFPVEVPESVGTGGGLKALKEGKASLARTARPLKLQEEAAGLRQETVARCPVAFAANVPGAWNPELTPERVLAVYSGQCRDWAELSSGQGKVYPLTREPGDAMHQVLSAGLPGFADLKEGAAKTVYTTPEAVLLLTRHKNSLGFATLPAFAGSGLTILPLSGVAPDARSLQTGKYPLSLPLALAWKGDPRPQARVFLDFLRTAQARTIILEHGCLPAGP